MVAGLAWAGARLPCTLSAPRCGRRRISTGATTVFIVDHDAGERASTQGLLKSEGLRSVGFAAVDLVPVDSICALAHELRQVADLVSLGWRGELIVWRMSAVTRL
jgi:hypothetical protein